MATERPDALARQEHRQLTVTIKVNGATAAEYGTDKMLFSAQHYLSQISKYMTLYPGDVVWLGTDGATEPALQDGDMVEIGQKDIGVLSNPVKRAKS
ncbi:MAG: fumarylacetoacetate hydrolase family protein [Betaproteobacteria bacterium]|nr:fumarylacetoacetate hydrolase family protein [Betaproteobacteria bacterium]